VSRTVTVAILRAKVVRAAELHCIAPGPEPVSYDVGDEVDLYLSDGPYTSAATDTPASHVFRMALRTGLGYEHELLESSDPPRLAGVSVFSRGAGLSLSNADDRLSAWCRSLSFDGQSVEVREVVLTWSNTLAAEVPEPLAAARVVFSGTAAGRPLLTEEGALYIRFKDATDLFAKIERTKMLGLGGAIVFAGAGAGTVAHHSSLNVNHFSFVCLWSHTGLAADQAIVSKTLISSSGVPFFARKRSDGRLSARVTTGAGSVLMDTVSLPAANTQYWVALTYNGANAVLRYWTVAGVLVEAVSVAQTGTLLTSSTALVIGSSSSTPNNALTGTISEVRLYTAGLSLESLEELLRPLDVAVDTASLLAYWPCNERVLTGAYDPIGNRLMELTSTTWTSLYEGEADQAGQFWPDLVGYSRSAPLVPVDQPLQIFACRRGRSTAFNYIYASNVPLAPDAAWIASDYVFSATAKTITTVTGSFFGMVPDQQILITGAGAGANNGATKTIDQILGPKVIRTIEALTSVTAATSVTLSTVTPQWRALSGNRYVEILTAFKGELTADVDATFDGGPTWQDQAEYLAGLAGVGVLIDAGPRASWPTSVHVPPDEAEGYLPALARLMRSVGGWCSVIGSDLVGGIIDLDAAPGDPILAHKVISINQAQELSTPPLRVPIGYAPAHAVLDNRDSEAAALPAQVAFARLPFRLYRSPDIISADYPLAAEAEVYETALLQRENAKVLSETIEAVAGGLVWTAQLMPDVDVAAGELRTVYADRAGFEEGRDCWVVGVVKDSETQELTVRLLEILT
jgi:hypothetical protein